MFAQHQLLQAKTPTWTGAARATATDALIVIAYEHILNSMESASPGARGHRVMRGRA
jgi:uncharacterized protein